VTELAFKNRIMLYTGILVLEIDLNLVIKLIFQPFTKERFKTSIQAQIVLQLGYKALCKILHFSFLA